MSLPIAISPYATSRQEVLDLGQQVVEGGLDGLIIGDGMIGTSSFPIWSGGTDSFVHTAWLARQVRPADVWYRSLDSACPRSAYRGQTGIVAGSDDRGPLSPRRGDGPVGTRRGGFRLRFCYARLTIGGGHPRTHEHLEWRAVIFRSVLVVVNGCGHTDALYFGASTRVVGRG